MAVKENYRAREYTPDRVTGRYVRGLGGGKWRVFECADGVGRFAGQPGHGPTLREWETDGEGLPDGFRPTWNDGMVKWPE